MKLLLNSPNNRLRYKVDRIDSARTRTPFSNINDNNLAFSGREKLIQELAGETEKLIPKLLNKAKRIFIVLGGETFKYERVKEDVAPALNKIFGSVGETGYFSNALKKAGFSDDISEIIYKDESFIASLAKTLKYPFVDLPRDFSISLAKKGLLPKGILDTKIIQNRIIAKDKEKNYKFVGEVLKDFSSSGKNLAQRTENFAKKVANRVTEPVKEYESRDERTLNRVVTSLVSAWFSGTDFFNLTMLHKDDKKQAEESGKSRFKQEFKRMAISAGTTFVALGALSKYTKSSVLLNAIVIAGGEAISQIVSRITSGTPLVWLSPEKAAKIAKETKPKEEALKQEFRSVLEPIKKEVEAKRLNNALFSKRVNNAEVYAPFTSHDGVSPALKTLYSNIANTNENENKPKKKSYFLKNLLVVFAGFNLLYGAIGLLKGRFKVSANKKNIINKNKETIIKLLKKEAKIAELEKFEEAIYGLKKVAKKTEEGSILKPLEDFRDKLITKEVEVNLDNLKGILQNLRKDKSASDIQKVVDKYLQIIGDNGTDEKLGSIKINVDRALPSGFYKGFTKIFKTVYDILTIPAKLVENLFFGKTNKQYDEIIKELGYAKPSNKKIIGKLNDIVTKNTRDDAIDYAGISRAIKKATRNYETAANTGDLANTSRTMVTALSTYFFVNDYRNKALIESEGKDIDEANVVMKEKVGHKAANFIINGTLMNLANSIFAKTLNKSLLGATIIAACTEFVNETLIRFSICQPRRKMESKAAIVEYEESRLNSQTPLGAWARLFSKITGKKSLTQKAKASK